MLVPTRMRSVRVDHDDDEEIRGEKVPTVTKNR